MNTTRVNFSEGRGLVPAVIQDDRTGDVLMLGYMNEEALAKTRKTGQVYFWSRKRRSLWRKGETSGNTFAVASLTPDCDRDAILVRVNPAGPACHTGTRSCFTGKRRAMRVTIPNLFATIEARQGSMPGDSYTASLFRAGMDRIAQKVGEEATEVVIAAKNRGRGRFIGECADLVYHLFVLMAAKRVSIADIEDVLTKRRQNK